MSFVGVSVVDGGVLLGSPISPTTAGASGYHLLVIEGYSRTPALPYSGPIESRCFTVGGYRWSIYCDLVDNGGSLSLGLFLDVNPAGLVKAHVEFSFADETNEEPASIHGSEILELRCDQCHNGLKDIEIETLKKRLRDDSFTIRCDIVVLNPTSNTSQFIDVPPSDMQRNFTNLLLSREGTDVAFRVRGETFAAHRCVLAARSTVFRAALFSPMKEGMSSTVAAMQIDDMDDVVFKAMLGFIYGDVLPAVNEEEDEDVVLLQHLLVAADRYDLRRLRLMCEKKLHGYIGVGTVTIFIALAEQYGCDGLKKACYEFLRCPDNLRAVVDTDGFDDLCRSCPSLMKDMILGVLPPK
ncbi:BTB/POZ and MATH domain-containing protein 2-like [Triticum dicoccoides]|uniref:BTB/POZ and MATH domain-containing protein 2-like n=1 Tax=Triticum dicoccoides TaxID=85692 RepID=UPI001890D33D|nr:BTB/POZ and MATH domain-containing protein 2-like [Triticum dicoccoides]